MGTERNGGRGAGLTRYLLAAGVDVVEVNRGHSLTRSRSGKNDAIDAEQAARKVLSGECSSPAKDTTGAVEAIRHLHLVRDSAIKSRTAALVQLRDILVTAPGLLKQSLDATPISPVPVSSVKSHRMRLHRGGDRQANRVFYLITVGRLKVDPKSQVYRDRKRSLGHSKGDIIRSLKRYVALELYYPLRKDLLLHRGLLKRQLLGPINPSESGS